MGHKNFAFGKLHDLFGYLMKLGRILHHVIGNAGKVGNKIGDRPLRINEGMIFIGDLVPIVNKDGDLRDPVLGGLAPGGFNIDNSVQRQSSLFQSKDN